MVDFFIFYKFYFLERLGNIQTLHVQFVLHGGIRMIYCTKSDGNCEFVTIFCVFAFIRIIISIDLPLILQRRIS